MEWCEVFPIVITVANSYQTFSSCSLLVGLSTSKSAALKSWTLNCHNDLRLW